MRFHIGCSFRLKSLTKFLIPIGLGILAYFGFGGLFGCIQVYARTNYDTSYTLDLVEPPLNNTMYDNVTYKDFYDSIIDLESQYYNIMIIYNITSLGMESNIYLVPKSDTSVDINIYGYGTNFFYWDVGVYLHRYYFSYNSDLTSNEVYANFLSCYQYNTDCEVYPSTGTEISISEPINYEYPTNNLTNEDSFTFNWVYYLYYSNVDLVYSPDDYGMYTMLVKALYIDDVLVPPDEPLPSYVELYGSSPDNPDNPESDSIIDYIYWFTGDNLTEYDVLLNIYVLLFLYCISMIVLKLLMIVKGVKW